jgi:hypothetical protein
MSSYGGGRSGDMPHGDCSKDRYSVLVKGTFNKAPMVLYIPCPWSSRTFLWSTTLVHVTKFWSCLILKALFGRRGLSGFIVSYPGPLWNRHEPRPCRLAGRFWAGSAPWTGPINAGWWWVGSQYDNPGQSRISCSLLFLRNVWADFVLCCAT